MQTAATRVRFRLALAGLVAAGLLTFTATASGAETLLGVHGKADRFRAQTGQRSHVRHVFLGWNQGYTWGKRFDPLFARLGQVPMVALKTGNGRAGSEVITPRGIAMGKGDRYLVALNRAVRRWNSLIYVRPLAEMNGHWNVYSAFNRDGSPRGRSHSTKIFRKAFARMYLILHGGRKSEINAKLRRLKLPPIKVNLPENPPDRLRVIWNPQGFGSPNIKANSAQAYYPGDAYVDVVGNDLYLIGGKAEWKAAEALYKAHPTKPYAFPEWGLWGVDDPAFVRRMGRFVRTHERVELIAYYQSKPGSVFDLATKPASRKAYRQAITSLP